MPVYDYQQIHEKRKNYFILFTLVLVFLAIMIANMPVLKSYIFFIESQREERQPQML